MRQHVMRFHKNVGWHNYFDNSNWSKTCKGWINFWNLLYVQLHRPQPSAALESTLSCSGLHPQLHQPQPSAAPASTLSFLASTLSCTGLNPQLHRPQPSAAPASTLSCTAAAPASTLSSTGLNPQLHWNQPSAAPATNLSCSDPSQQPQLFTQLQDAAFLRAPHVYVHGSGSTFSRAITRGSPVRSLESPNYLDNKSAVFNSKKFTYC
jgi:hypothetical protein